MSHLPAPQITNLRCAPTRALPAAWLLAALLLSACTGSDGAPPDKDADDAGETMGSDPQTAVDAEAPSEPPRPPRETRQDAGTSAMDGGRTAPAGKDASSGAMLDAGGPVARADAAADGGPVIAEAGMDASTAPDAEAKDGGADASMDAASIYDDDRRWLCRPGLPNNRCAQNIEVTDVQPDGGTSVSQLPKTPNDVAADCLYLYPTIDPGVLSPPRNLDFDQIDMVSVRDIFAGQGLPFREACAVWAPVYRQTSLNSFEQPETRERGLATAFRDVEAAFDYYLAHAASDRPIVIIAHSQGAILMTRLLKERFEGNAALMRRLVVAVLAGPLGGFVVPEGKAVGGTLQQIPLCSAPEQTGCALTFATFAARMPPNDEYGRVNGGVERGFDTGCTTPPGGPSGMPVRLSSALFAPLTGPIGTLAPMLDYGRLRIRTQLVRYPDFYTASCERSGRGLSYLRVSAAPLAGDVRVDPVLYDSATLNSAEIGLHALDYAFVSGDLIRTVKTRVAAHRR